MSIKLNLPLRSGFSTQSSHSLISVMTSAFQPKKPNTEPVFYSGQGSFTTKGNLTDNMNVKRINVLFSRQNRNETHLVKMFSFHSFPFTHT